MIRDWTVICRYASKERILSWTNCQRLSLPLGPNGYLECLREGKAAGVGLQTIDIPSQSKLSNSCCFSSLEYIFGPPPFTLDLGSGVTMRLLDLDAVAIVAI